jgi:beta-glucosidase
MIFQEPNAQPIYLNSTKKTNERVVDLLNRMTLDEKIAQLGSCWIYEITQESNFNTTKAKKILEYGIGQITRVAGASNRDPKECGQIINEIQEYLINNTRLGIPAMFHEECCSGYTAKGATIFPQAIGLASSWSPEIMNSIGDTIRIQIRAVGAHQGLSPVLDITRDARWGRVEETYGEDPYLAAKMGCSYIRGLQGESLRTGVIATAKHFVGYGASEGGMNWAPVHIPERELLEVYLIPFEAAIKEANLASLMPGYHELDGDPCSASQLMLREILREKFGFEGIVVSDYFAINMLQEYHHLAKDKNDSALLALKAGIDIELPSTDCYGEALRGSISKGFIPEELINEAVSRILTMKFNLGLFESPYVDVSEKIYSFFDNPTQRALARQAAQKSIVLLKNDQNILPLRKELSAIAVIGPNADSKRNLLGDYTYPSMIEALVDSNQALNATLPDDIDTTNNLVVPVVSVLEGIKAKISPQTKVYYAKGCEILGNDDLGFVDAVEVAKKADVAIVVVGDKCGLMDDCSCGEARDRASLDLPGVQEDLVRAVYATGTPVIVVLINGRPLSIKWIVENIPGIIEAWIPGEEGGNAIADILFGDECPGGKLPITFPRAVGQVPIFYAHKPSGGRSNWKVDYVELSSKPLYPFGFGLSYTQFEYRNLFIQAEKDKKVSISFEVQNIGSRSGDEIPQLYIHRKTADVTQPVKEIKGFTRVTLKQGEIKTIQFEVDLRQLGYLNHDLNYVLTPGEIEVMIGSSSEDIRLKGSFETRNEGVVDKVFFSNCTII